jgi:hypothetical protein
VLNGTGSFAAGQSTAVIPVSPIDDNRPELAESITVTILPSANYFLGLITTSTVTLADDGDTTPLFTLVTSDTNAYERVSGLLGAYMLTRTLGELLSAQTINFTLTGTAVLGVDYVSSATNSVAFDPGITTQTIQIIPLNNSLVDGERTVILNVQANPAIILDMPASTTVTIVDDEVAAETVLWSDNFDDGTSAVKYSVKAGSDLGVDDYSANFSFDYSQIGLPPAPGSSTTMGLMVDANAMNAPAGVNFYPVGQNFSGDLALRFNLYVSMDPLAGADNEAAYFGLNQTGQATNWLGALGGVYTNYGEGVWATTATRDGTPGIFTLRAVANAGAAPVLVGSTGNLPDLFNAPPHAQVGRPNNAYDSTNKTWADCELSQVAGIVTLKVNNSVVLQYTNTAPAQSGNVFIGYGDPFATLGSANCYAIFDNIRVVRMVAAPPRPHISDISVNGSLVEVLFTAGAGDSASAFKLQAASTADGSFADDNTAVITGMGAGQFKAVTSTSGPARFYRIRR